MKLQEINSELIRIFTELEENGGELTPEIEESLMMNDKDFESKAEAYISTIMDYSADVEKYKKEIERLTARRRTAENTVLSLKKMLHEAMVLRGEDKAKIGTFSMRINRTKSVSITDEALIPQEYHVKQPDKIDKAGIKEALKNGLDVEGAELVENTSIVIR